MPTANLIGNDKGGVGKSMVSRTLLHLHVDNLLPFAAFDTDRNNPDFKRCCSSVYPVKLAVFSEAERLEDAANIIFNTAMEQDVLVNLPAGVSPALHSWIENNQLIELAAETDVIMRMFFVTDGSFESIKLFKHSLKMFGHCMSHVLLKNHGMNANWSSLINDETTQALINQYNVTTVDFPKFIGRNELLFMDANSLSFGEALTHPDLGAISRHRVKTFLKKAYQAFEEAQLFPLSTAQKIQPGGQYHG